MKTSLITLWIIGITLGGLVGYFIYPQINKTIQEYTDFGDAGGFYSATSTPSLSAYSYSTGTSTDSRAVKTGFGTLRRVLVTKAGSLGVLDLYNATTTNLTTGNSARSASSTLHIVSIPLTAVGEYDFDAVFTDGLFAEFTSGHNSFTTIIYD